MKRRNSSFYHILVFVLAQIAWLGLLGIWIYWYISNNIIFQEVGDRLSPQIDFYSPNIFLFVGGIILIVAIGFVISIIFRNLNVQLRLTRLYDNFIANVTHELKSPLASIQLYLETMNTRKVPQEDRKKFIETMLKDTRRLNNLINSILEIPRIELKKVAHSFHVYNAGNIIKSLFNETIDQYNLTSEEFNISGIANCECVVDPNAIKIVFNNLVDNAIKYSVPPVKIDVSFNCDRKNVFIHIADNGIGLGSKDQKRIFKKFQRIYRNDIPSVKGTGLGLYWVKEIVKSHGGEITVQSQGINKGTTFTIELPIYKASKRAYVNYLLRTTRKRENERERLNEK